MKLFKTTKRWIRYWQRRKIDWQAAYTSTLNHPHRDFLMEILRRFWFRAILEIGCASGPNLLRILQHWPGTEVGGVDVSEDAIKQARKNIPQGVFEVRSADELFFSNNVADGAISDACMIYLDRRRAKKALAEVGRCTKHFVVLCEFHSTSWLSRILLRMSSGYYAHNYRKLLESLNYYDIQIIKFPKDLWPGLPWERYGHFIIARCPPN